MKTYEKVTHTFEPVYDENSRILILGTFPSVKSREQQFYYGHPQNRFWKLLAALTGWKVPKTISEKKELLLQNGIAIWDVVASCEIVGSSDSSIRNVVPADLNRILQAAPVRKIYANGGKEICFSGNRKANRKTSLHKSCQCSLADGSPERGLERDLTVKFKNGNLQLKSEH